MQPKGETISMERRGGVKGERVRLLHLDQIDRRTASYQRIRMTRDAVVNDLGGEPDLSTLELIGIDHVSMLAAMIADKSARWMAGEAVDPTELATLTNVYNRTATALGWKRRSRDITDFADIFTPSEARHEPA